MFSTSKKTIIPYLFVGPVCLFLLLFCYLPFPYMFYLSVHKKTGGTGENVFVGFENFQKLLVSSNFWESLGRTVYYVLGVTIVVIILSMIAAVILNSKIKCSNAYIVIMFIPWIVSEVVASFSWKWLLNADFGLLDYYLGPLGIKASALLSNPKLSMLLVILVSTWRQVAYRTIFLLSGLQNVDHELIEASKLDGCSSWQSFWKVSFPIFSPMLCVTILLTMVGMVSQTGLTKVLTEGGPASSTTTLAYYLYMEAFNYFRLTDASAIGMILGIVNMAIAVLYFYFNKKSKELVS